MKLHFKLPGLILIMALLTAAPVAMAAPTMTTVILSSGDSPTLYTGVENQEIASIFITEKSAAALASGSKITVQLPENAVWNQVPTIMIHQGDIVIEPGGISSEDGGRTISYEIIKAGTSPSDLELIGGRVTIESGTGPGVLMCTVNNVSRQTVGRIAPPLQMSVKETISVAPGAVGQQVGEVVIDESVAGAIVDFSYGQHTHLYLMLPQGVGFAYQPEVRVDGSLNVDIPNVKLLAGSDGTVNNILDIPITRSSVASPSRIYLGEFRLNIGREVPAGSIDLVARGSAVDPATARTAGSNPSLYTRNAAILELATCTVPFRSSYAASFTVGSNTFLGFNGETAMDTAPYEKDGRVYVPYRFLALAIGIPDDPQHIAWDEATQTVTLTTYNGSVVSATVGSDVLYVDGQAVQMDVKAEMTGDRVFLPARWLVESLGGIVTWDEASSTVDISIFY